VHLQPKTIEVLAHLLSQPGAIVSQQELIDVVWAGRVVESGTVARNIAQIRKALGDDSHNPTYIRTVPKRGYSTIAPVSPTSQPLPNSIAVLPFHSLSPDPSNAYFATGIHQEILNQLAKIKELSVIARTTMLRYAGSDKSIPEIGAELNVRAVMEGSVRYSGDRVRITAQLIDSESGVQIWSEAYEEKLEDIFGIQLEIATRIADTLGAEFSLRERERIGHRASNNVEAYGHYLRALAGMMNLSNINSVHKALDAATRLDPDFGAAFAFKAWLHVVEAAQGGIFFGRDFNAQDQEQRLGLAKQFADRALDIDDQQARAHLAYAFVNYHGRKWQAAAESMDRAYALDPSDYVVVNGKAWSTYWRGDDIELVLKYVDRAIGLNPADAANIWNSGELLYLTQRWEAARSRANLVIGLLPDVGLGYAQLALVSSRRGDLNAVRRNAELAEARNLGLQDYQSLARAYGHIGELGEAQRIYELAGAGNEPAICNSGWQFWMHMAVRDYASAIGYLELVVEENFPFGSVVELHTSANHPDYDPIRSHPRFDYLVRKAGMPN